MCVDACVDIHFLSSFDVSCMFFEVASELTKGVEIP